MKTSAAYKIVNTVTNDFYIGSSKDVKRRWAQHKCPSTWENCPNNPLYNDMQKYGVDKFDFQILANVEVDKLKETEQQFIEMLKPTYNKNNANGFDIERWKEYQKKYRQSDKGKEYHKEYMKEYRQFDKYKEYQKEYHQSEKKKEVDRKASNKYSNQLCSYNGETLKLGTLATRFRKAGIEHYTSEAKKYLILQVKQEVNNNE